MLIDASLYKSINYQVKFRFVFLLMFEDLHSVINRSVSYVLDGAGYRI
jgi:hypothetical protein